MIIDEILDAKYKDYKLDRKYILDEASIMGFDYIKKAYETNDPDAIKQALARYIVVNGYDYHITNILDKIKKF